MPDNKVMVIGSGGREHALCWKLSMSSHVKEVICAPGNGGIAQHARCVDIKAEDIEGIARFCEEEGVDLTVVGPEAPLALGIVDEFQRRGLRIFGPDRKAAQIEASKAFTKSLLFDHNIPTGKSVTFKDSREAIEYARSIEPPVVLKADGLAAGKGVIIANSREEAIRAIEEIMVKKAFGSAGNRIIVEEFLSGEEASFMAITDGKTVLPLATSQDHKPIYDGDIGPNTGGMGAYSPAPIVDEAMFSSIMDKIMVPTVSAMQQDETPYMGVLYGGLIIKDNIPKVLEFNCRFGDPEAQPILMRLKSDLFEVIMASLEGRLGELDLKWDERSAVCIVLASKGYPGKYEKGKLINGLEEVSRLEDVFCFHAGTRQEDGRFYTNGGRVLGITALGATIEDAIERAYEAASMVSWDGMYYRYDIGQKALKYKGSLNNPMPLVGIVMGSPSDKDVMKHAGKALDDLGIPYEMKALSAHRSPELSAQYAALAAKRGIKVIIAGAGMAAHLAGAMAAHAHIPVIGVPIASSPLNGIDALLSTVQMPPGVPVGTVGIGNAGAKNAAILAAQIIGTYNKGVERRIISMKRSMRFKIEMLNS